MESVNFNIAQLIILFGSVQGVVFSVIVFFVKKYRSKSNFYLGLTILCLSISNIQHILIDVHYFTLSSIVSRLYIPWQWLIGPFFYFFVHFFLQNKRIAKGIRISLLAPFFLVTLTHLFQFMYQLYFAQDYVITNYYERGLFLYTNIISFVFLPIVSYKLYKMILLYEKEHERIITKIKEETNWLKKLLYVGIGILSLGALSVIGLLIFNAEESFIAYPFFISLSLWIYWVGYIGLQKATSYKALRSYTILQTPKKKGSETFQKISTYITDEKKYLSPNISLNSIAEQFSISNGYLSQLFNMHASYNFNDYINELRIKASKKMLLDPVFNNYTVEAIGLECGFKSKSSFYTAFKKFSKETPNQFKKAKNKS